MIISIITMLITGVFKMVPGLASTYTKHRESMAVQDTKRQGIWSDTLLSAANIDVENRKLAMQERSNSPMLMRMYVVLLFFPILYYTMYWMDTIFAGQVWEINLYFFTIPIWDWEKYVLKAAPPDLAEMGKWLIGIFVGGNTAVNGIVKGAVALKASGIIKGR